MEMYLVLSDASIKNALKQMDKAGSKTIFVVEKGNVLAGVISGGDVRRAVLGKVNLNKRVTLIMNSTPTVVNEDYDINTVKKIMLTKKHEAIPVINSNRQVIDVLLWNRVFKEQQKRIYPKLNVPVVIIAGGEGTRLDPFTRILPKALIPIGDKPMIEIIMDEYAKFGISEFYISINHKKRMIKAYFDDNQSNFDIKYIVEDKPLGTAGSLKFLERQIHIPFFVSNCDILIDADYSKIYEYHKNNGLDLTIVSSIQHHTIPYGICEIENGGSLKSITEKPQYSFLVNTGMYVISPEVLSFLPVDEFCHMTHLIETLKNLRKHIGVFPVSEGSWIDVGQWKQYENTINDLFDNENVSTNNKAFSRELSGTFR